LSALCRADTLVRLASSRTELADEDAESSKGFNDPQRCGFLCFPSVRGAKVVFMNVDSIRAYCLGFPEAKEKLQWGDALCFKVREKMFAVLGLDRVRLTFKCTPEIFAELIERPDIRPSPYLGRHKWVMLDRLAALRTDELKELIRQSYEMVAATAPGKKSGKKKTSAKIGAPSRTRKKKR
jgi:predicted DNA-binding protein (MmcQ/YjbR family)